jgi:hypothetical protein
MRHLIAVLGVLLISLGIACHAAELPDHDGVELVFGDAALSRIEAQFAVFDPTFKERRDASREVFDRLGRRLFARERQGENLACSRQLFIEAKWLLGYTAWWDRLQQTLDALDASFALADQDFATQALPLDGLFGLCNREYFIRIEATLEAYFVLADRGELPLFQRPPKPWARSPEALTAFLNERLVSTIVAEGEDKRSRIGGLMSILVATQRREHVLELIRATTAGEPLPPEGVRAVQDRLLDFIDAWQDAETGYWGAWYRDGDAVFKTTDLSITYHIVHALKGNVRHWPAIIETTLALREQTYPFGWLSRGRWNNHNNYDVVRIFRYGWPHMTVEQQTTAATIMQEMLDWAFAQAVHETYEGFRLDHELSSSVGAELYFGVSFLDAVGFFAEVPWLPELRRPADPASVCAALIAHAQELALDAYVSGAQQKLYRACAPYRR